MTVVLYHNPQCSKSRATLALLKEHGITPQIIEYKKDPPSKDTILAVLKALNLPPQSLLRRGDRAYGELGLEPEPVDPEAIASVLSEHPALMQRPVVVNGAAARIGRPPEAVLEIL